MFKAAGILTFDITSNINWIISADTWLSITPLSGNGDVTVSVTCSRSLIDRSGTITVSGGSITKTINVTQLGEGLIPIE